MNKIIIKNSTIYVVGNLMIKLFGIIIIPLYLNYLTTEEYGKFSILSAFISVMIYIVAFSLYYAIIRFYTEYEGDRGKISKLFSGITIFTFLSGSIFLILSVIFRDFLSRNVLGGIQYFPYIFLAVLAVIFESEYLVYQNILRTLEKASRYIGISISYFAINIFSLVLFLIILDWKVEGILISMTISYLMCSVVMVYDLIKLNYFTFHIDFNILKNALKYTLPLIPHNLSAPITQFVSRLFIGASKSFSEVGIYNLASQIGVISDVIQNSVYMAIQPWMFKQLKTHEENWKNKIGKITSAVMWCYSILFLLLVYFTQEAVFILANSQYRDVWKVVPFIVLTNLIKAPYYFYIHVLFYHKKASRYIFLITLGTSMLNIILSYFFIRKWGMYGSLMADILAMIIRIIIVIRFSTWIENIGINLKKLIVTILSTVIMGFVGLLPTIILDGIWNVGVLVYKILVFIIYLYIVMRINGYGIKKIRTILGERKRLV